MAASVEHRHAPRNRSPFIGNQVDSRHAGIADSAGSVLRRPRDLAKTLEAVQALVDEMARLLIQQAGVLPRMTNDPYAPGAGRGIAEASAIVTQLNNQLIKADVAADYEH
ncbi:hypothetical protein ACFYUY_34895 [Kitasatospora sp. NPDC004745]|uniref:hypothetical protein n=1 Tax=Kitasatospora sp. NPDC004745 TaxID=3364019 RepID=UPI00367E55D4